MLFAASIHAQDRIGMEYDIKDSKTLAIYKKNILEFQKEGKTSELARAYKRVADYYYKVPYHDSLLMYYKLALQQYEAVNDSFYISYCFHRIGAQISYTDINVETAFDWLKPAASYFERHGDVALASHANYDIYLVYRKKGPYEKQQYYFDKAIYFNKIANDSLLWIIIRHEEGIKFRMEKQWNHSIQKFLEVIELSRAINNTHFLKVGLVNLSSDYLQVGALEKALESLKEVEEIAIRTKTSLSETYHLFAICYIRLNNLEEAEKYFSLYKEAVDSTAERQQKDKTAELLVLFETEKQKTVITGLQEANKYKDALAYRQRIFITVLAIGLGILLLFGWIVYRNMNHRRKLQLQLSKQEEEFSKNLNIEKQEKIMAEFNKQLAEVQLTALSAQMNPHFIFNCMNSIQKYILKNEKNKALVFLQNFSDLMRSVLDNSAKPKIGLDEEIGMLTKYILLEQQRLDNKFDFNIEVSADLQADFFEIPAMIIQPYVENAIWHGLMNLEQLPVQEARMGILLLKFDKMENSIRCIVEDNGVGRTAASEFEKLKSPVRKSFGMNLAQKRLELLRKDNIDIPQIVIEDLMSNDLKPCGTRVTINIQTD